MTTQGLQELREALPNCKIDYSPPAPFTECWEIEDAAGESTAVQPEAPSDPR